MSVPGQHPPVSSMPDSTSFLQLHVTAGRNPPAGGRGAGRGGGLQGASQTTQLPPLLWPSSRQETTPGLLHGAQRHFIHCSQEFMKLSRCMQRPSCRAKQGLRALGELAHRAHPPGAFVPYIKRHAHPRGAVALFRSNNRGFYLPTNRP